MSKSSEKAARLNYDGIDTYLYFNLTLLQRIFDINNHEPATEQVDLSWRCFIVKHGDMIILFTFKKIAPKTYWTHLVFWTSRMAETFPSIAIFFLAKLIDQTSYDLYSFKGCITDVCNFFCNSVKPWKIF